MLAILINLSAALCETWETFTRIKNYAMLLYISICELYVIKRDLNFSRVGRAKIEFKSKKYKIMGWNLDCVSFPFYKVLVV